MLSDEEKCELIGIVSGFSDEAATARAQALIERDPEAARFFHEIDLLTKSLEPPPESEEAPLDPAEAKRISNGAYARWRRRRARRLLVPAGVAAAVLLVGVGLNLALRDRPIERPVGPQNIVVIPHGAWMGVPTLRREPISPAGEVSTAADVWAATETAGGAKIALNAGSRAVFAEDGSIDLRQGELFIQATSPIGFRAGPVAGRAKSGEVLISRSESELRCTVFSGTATVQIGERTLSLRAGEGLTLALPDGQPGTTQEAPAIPGWVKRSLEVLQSGAPR